MSIIKPSIPKGTRDFSAKEMIKRNYIFDIIKSNFKRFGFLPIETPSMENLSTLTGKYGDEGDQLIFKVLNSGEYLNGIGIDKKVLEGAFNQMEMISPNYPLQYLIKERNLTPLISEKALRYDLTVPFARYVVMHKNELSFPFKRYQIQPVWRADRPQKGRYREFYQCDADIIGSNSLTNEWELIQLFDEVFSQLNLPVKIKINNRKILTGIANYIEQPDKIIDITIAIDKLDKIGIDKVIEELQSKGLNEGAIDKLKPLLSFKPISEMTSETINWLDEITGHTEDGKKGLEELKFLFDLVAAMPLKNAQLEFDLTLARGLNYYTGAIFEVKVNHAETDYTGSVCGGGRYDDLTGIFGLPNMSGVGISFGADRIYDVLEELNLFPENANESIKVMLANFGITSQQMSLKIVHRLRAQNIACLYYPDEVKMKKQFAYADDLKIPYVIIIGEEEIANEKISLKNMATGVQEMLTITALIEKIK